MGTMVTLVVDCGPDQEPAARRAVASACTRLHEIDATFSTWDPTSPMSRFRRGEMDLPPPEIAHVLVLCEQARRLSGGWFDPWALPDGVDPTGLVKGWAAQEAAAVLASAGVRAASVNAGGDIAVVSCAGRRWRFGIRHPWRTDAIACIVEVSGAVATSGTYERPPHLVVPEHLAAIAATHRRPVSATVTAERLDLADALATALCVGGTEVLELIEATPGFEGYLIFDDGGEASTGGFPFAS